ncbi:hypothetical protein ACWD4O_38725 [Streptomyces sp. NPDC002623]
MTRPTRGARPPGRGRGRPTVFTDGQKTAYLKHVTAGLNLNQAAAAVGVDRRTVNHHATNDPAFREARDTAKTAGRAARWDDKPHDEYRYNHLKCRCDDCTAAHRQARAGRRAAPEPAPDTVEETRPVVLHLPARPAHDAPATLTA